MANFIQQLKVGDQTYDLYDSEFIVDTRTASGSALTGISKATELFDGMQITFWLAYASGSNSTLNLTLSNSTTTGDIPCYYNGTVRLGTQYSAGNAIQFVYRSNVTIGGTTISAGWWVSTPSIPNVPSAPTTDGSYNLNVSSGTATWVESDSHALLITGTPTGDLADYPIITDTSWSDYISAITRHSRIILDMPLAGMQVELFAQDYNGAYVNTIVMYSNFVMSAVLSATEDTSTHTVIFELDQNITTWSAYSEYASAVDWSGVENAPEVQPSVGSIVLTTSWSGNGPYTQTVIISGSTSNSKIDLQPNATVLSQMASDGTTALYIENNNNTLTAYAIGAAPTAALSIQYTRTEVTTA